MVRPGDPGRILADQIVADADHAAGGQRIEFAVGDRGIDDGDAAQPPAARRDGGEHERIVGAEKGRLHQHRLADAVGVERRRGRTAKGRVVVRRVAATGRQGEAADEDVGVGVDGRDGGCGHGHCVVT